MVGVFRPFFWIVCADDEVAAGHSLKELRHIIAAGTHYCLAGVYILLTDRRNGSAAHKFCHCLIINAWGAAVDNFHVAGTTHRACHARRHFANTAQQFFTVFLCEGTHGAIHYRCFRDDVERGASRNLPNSNHSGAERRGLAADERLECRNDVGRDDDGINRCFGHGCVTALPMNGQGNPICAGEDRA